MDFKESAQVLAVLTAAYPNAYKNLTENEATAVTLVWATQFADIAYDIVFLALQKAISTCKYPPTVCEVKEKLSGLHWEAYEKLRQNNELGDKLSKETKAKYKYIYESTEEFRYKKPELELEAMLPYSSQTLTAGMMIEGE